MWFINSVYFLFLNLCLAEIRSRRTLFFFNGTGACIQKTLVLLVHKNYVLSILASVWFQIIFSLYFEWYLLLICFQLSSKYYLSQIVNIYCKRLELCTLYLCSYDKKKFPSLTFLDNVVNVLCLCYLVELILKVLNFGKNCVEMEWVDPDSYCSWQTLWSGIGEVVAVHTSPTLHPIPSHCAVIILFKGVPVHQLSWLAQVSSSIFCLSLQTANIRWHVCNYTQNWTIHLMSVHK